ncbi:MAG: ribonuclease inhibitor [Sphingomonadales bacterium]|nr:MAG: ribonuclease inhibitor [Sphingomonadales bacterium]
MTTLTLNGAAITDIPSFYAELNRVFMANEDWKLGESLDALNDLLYGGYGALHGADTATIIWTHYEASREALGDTATRAWLQSKIAAPHLYNAAHFTRELAALNTSAGQTYFARILEVFAEHKNIELQPA